MIKVITQYNDLDIYGRKATNGFWDGANKPFLFNIVDTDNYRNSLAPLVGRGKYKSRQSTNDFWETDFRLEFKYD